MSALRSVAAAALAMLTVLLVAQPAIAASRRERQWYLDYLKIDEVHKRSTGKGVLVAVVDTGVGRHPELAGQVVPGARADGVSGDGRSDSDGHGTRMAGVIAARNVGSDGVLGVAPGAKILPIKIDSLTLARGIRLAVDRGAKVINISGGGAGQAAQEEIDAVNYALSKDVVVVAAAGNVRQGDRQIGAPANIPGVIAVTGLDGRGSFWSGSVQGPEAVVAAPAENILNIDSPRVAASGYSIGSGTSEATAIVSGVAALVRSKYPNLDAPNVINRIIRTADDAGAHGRDTRYGFGKIDPMRALTANVPSVSSNPLLAEAATPTAASDGESSFDVTQYGDRDSFPNDRQVMIIGIAIGVLAFVVLVLIIVAVVRLTRSHRADARERRAMSAQGGAQFGPPTGPTSGARPLPAPPVEFQGAPPPPVGPHGAPPPARSEGAPPPPQAGPPGAPPPPQAGPPGAPPPPQAGPPGAPPPPGGISR